ncbi:hypothetical protein BZA77DRAFT_298387 [Pyronema omphalodes]|nr:hypothetical protein BZA77DRAFT_298387 [Pyronema omphalodes]
MMSQMACPSTDGMSIDYDYHGIEQRLTADFEKLASDINKHVLEQLSKFRNNLFQVLQAKALNEKQLRDKNDQLMKEIAENKQQFEIYEVSQRIRQEKIDKLWKRDEIFRVIIIELMLANEKLQDMRLNNGMKSTDLVGIDEVLQEELNEWLKVHEIKTQKGVEKWMDDNIKNIQSKMEMLRDNFAPIMKVTQDEQHSPQYNLKEPVNQRDITVNSSEIVQQLQQLNQKSYTQNKSSQSGLSKEQTAEATKSSHSDEKPASANPPTDATTSKAVVMEDTFQPTKEEQKKKNTAIRPHLFSNIRNISKITELFDSVLPEVADEFGAFCRKTPLKAMPPGRVMVENLAGTDIAARYAYVRWEKVRQFEDLQRLMMCIWGQGLGSEPQIFFNDEPKEKKDWVKLSGKMANITLCPDETLTEDDPGYWKIQCFDTTA